MPELYRRVRLARAVNAVMGYPMVDYNTVMELPEAELAQLMVLAEEPTLRKKAAEIERKVQDVLRRRT
jgi:hypothetical protein